VPSVRFSRDKRGYEYVSLVHTTTRRGKPGRTRVLYWYRTPPGVRIGRKPFDDEMQRSLEQQYPGVTFDWETIINTPKPPPDMTEFWRERRRADKAAKQERRAAEAEEAVASAPAATASPDAADTQASLTLSDVAEPATRADAFTSADMAVAESTDVDAASDTSSDGDTQSRKRRGRRGGRRRRGQLAEGAGQATVGRENSASLDDGGNDEMDDQPETSDSTSEEE
jgi:hypothetical protein